MICKVILYMPEPDGESNKDIIKFLEMEEIARNALQMTSSTCWYFILQKSPIVLASIHG